MKTERIDNEEQYERELTTAFEAFQRVKRDDILGERTGQKNKLKGGTFWDFAERFAHRDLEDMISFLEKNQDEMSFEELIEYHLKILKYFEGIMHLKTPGTQHLSADNLRMVLELFHRREEQQRLENRIGENENEAEFLGKTRDKINSFLAILHDHLYNDAESPVSPTERDWLMRNSNTRLASLQAFQKYISDSSFIKDLDETRLELQNLLSSEGQIVHKEKSLNAVPLEQKVKAYICCTLFLDHFEKEKKLKAQEIKAIRKSLDSTRLQIGEENQLSLFESARDARYSPAAYCALYTNAVWAQVKDFLAGLKKDGIPVNFNVNL